MVGIDKQCSVSVLWFFSFLLTTKIAGTQIIALIILKGKKTVHYIFVVYVYMMLLFFYFETFVSCVRCTI